ncbi:hypothetical protein K7432_011463 [Basidiobolus ranarum]|uniref:SANT domain-containing protein n=1 Tax=Basidiobolus ranarum TaxID=34480 RepID=A0ABR2VU77_9FUNG
MYTSGRFTSLRIDKGRTRFIPQIKQRSCSKLRAILETGITSSQTSENDFQEPEVANANVINSPIVQDDVERFLGLEENIISHFSREIHSIAIPSSTSTKENVAGSLIFATEGNNTASRRAIHFKKRSLDTVRGLSKADEPNNIDNQTETSTDHLNIPLFMFCKNTKLGKPKKNFINPKKRKFPKLNDTVIMKDVKPVVEDNSENLKLQTIDKESDFAPQMRVINGKLALDNSSLFVDRARINNSQDKTPIDVVEESAADRFVNSSTYLVKIKSQRWSPEETEVFYQGLAKWGTDFSLIASMLPNRAQKQIKYKFKKEERINSMRITEALIRRNPGTTKALSKKESTINHHKASIVTASSTLYSKQ